MGNTTNQMITMSTLGRRGRFGNQVFQYAFLKIYTSYYSLGLETGRWVGQLLFGHDDPPVTHVFPTLETKIAREVMKKKNVFTHTPPPFVNVDLNGQFMYHTRFYKPFKPLFRSLYQPVPEVFEKVNKGMTELRRRGKTIIGIHIRMGDFLKFKNHARNFIAPSSWYKEWLEKIWPTLEEPLLFLASDDLDSVLPDFKQYRPITSADVIKKFPKDVSYRPDSSFYPDFYLLTQCDLLAISNSSFSFSAGLLNEKCKTFMRPHPSQQLVPYDPWNSPVRLNFPVKDDSFC